MAAVADGAEIPDAASVPEAPPGGTTASVVGVAATLHLAPKHPRLPGARGATALPTGTAVVAAAAVES